MTQAAKRALPEIYLARHGETAWAISSRHTGLSDIPLTERGERNARALGERLKGTTFDAVWVSPLQRARRTCELAGFAGQAKDFADLVEWDYGDYEGLTTAEIRRTRPDWQLFRDGCPGGESVETVGARADRAVAETGAIGGRLLLFGHGHFFRVFAARKIGLAVEDARHLMLSTASLSILSYEHSLKNPAIMLWNDDRHVAP